MKQTLQLTALSAALVLAGCGGGGGFYGPSSTTSSSTTSGTSTTSGGTTASSAAVATNYHIVLTTSKPNMLVTGDSVTVTAKLLDVNGGGVANQSVVLADPNALADGTSFSGPSTATTDSTGTVTFTVNLPAESGTVASGLLANGLKLNASFTDATNKTILQSTLVNVIQAPAVASAAAVDHLVISSNVTSLPSTGGTATVTVHLLDQNGGGVAGDNVVLNIPNAAANGILISGPSQVTTDSTGSATYTVVLSGNSANTAALIASGISLKATFTDATNVSTSQTSLINVTAPVSASSSPAQLDHLLISSSKTSLVSTGDSATVTIKLVDQNGGGVSGQNVVLALPSAVVAEGVTSNVSTVATDVNGNATFTINLAGTTSANATALIASGIQLTASFTDSSNNSTSQVTTLAVAAPAPKPTTPLYHLVMNSSKPTLSATGDIVNVTVQVVDANGGGVSGQTVQLSVPNSAAEGFTIQGASSLVSDQYGNVTFPLALVTAGTSVNLNSIVASGLEVDAAVTDVNGNKAQQNTTLNVSTIPTPNITIGSNAANATSSDGTYYYTNFAVSVVDSNGKPIVNQPVSLSIALQSFGKGNLNFVLDPLNQVNPSAPQWYPYTVQDYSAAPVTNATYDATNFPYYSVFNHLIAGNVGGKFYPSPNNIPTSAAAGVGPYLYTPTAQTCAYNAGTTPFVQNAVTFVQATGTPAISSPSTTPVTSPTSGDSATTYTTDNSGAITFRVRYLRRYAVWQNVNITASTTLNGASVQASNLYYLQPTQTDIQTAAGQPYTASPYGSSLATADCTNQN